MKLWKVLLWGTAVLVLLTGCGLRNQSVEEELNPPTPDYDYAQGLIGYPILLQGVGMQVDNVQVISGEADGRAGFAYVVLTISTINETRNPIVPANVKLIDQFDNEYGSRQDGDMSFADQLVGMPLTINEQQSATGNQVFIVPISALGSGLKMRWESVVHQSRIDIDLGPQSLP